MWVFENQEMGKLLELLVDVAVKVVPVRKCYINCACLIVLYV
jgi:hypothetical protein